MKNNSRAFINQVMLCVLVTFCGAGAVGLGTVWMRHQISRTADRNRSLEASIQRIKRQIVETSVLVESAQSLAELRLRNSEFKLGLEGILETQVVHDTKSAEERLLSMRARSNRELMRDGASRDAVEAPATIMFKVAQHN
jgi:hypothetical protein